LSLGKKYIVENISTKAQISRKSSTLLLESFLNLVKTNKSSDVKLPGFGVFYLKKTTERIGRNPATNQRHIIPIMNKMLFKASNKIKAFIN
jgi:nucleoid DNA-binding protein